MHARREHGTLLRRPPPALGLGDRDVPLHQCEVLVDAALVLRLAKARVHLRGIRALRRRSSTCGALGLAAAWVLNSGQYARLGSMVRGTCGTAEAGTRTQYVPYAGPWGQVALRLRYVPNVGGWYA